MEQPVFDPRYHAVVPISYLDRLLRCYYGNGPRDLEKSETLEFESPATESVGMNFRNINLNTDLPEGFKPKGVAKRKQEAKNANRHDSVTEGQDSPSEGD